MNPLNESIPQDHEVHGEFDAFVVPEDWNPWEPAESCHVTAVLERTVVAVVGEDMNKRVIRRDRIWVTPEALQGALRYSKDAKAARVRRESSRKGFVKQREAGVKLGRKKEYE